jgi:hypothetical protein
MYVTVKMTPVETVPDSWEGRKKRAMEGINSNIYLVYCKNLCKYYNVPSLSTIKILKIKNKKSLAG